MSCYVRIYVYTTKKIREYAKAIVTDTENTFNRLPSRETRMRLSNGIFTVPRRNSLQQRDWKEIIIGSIIKASGALT
ncbi:MAG: hypothetical protein ACLR6B_03700 [Blautia sp.]